MIKKIIRFLLIKLKIIKFKNDPLGFAYQFDEVYYYDLLRKGYSYNGVLAKMFINELINDEKNQNISIDGNQFNDTFFGTVIPNGYTLEFNIYIENENYDTEKNIEIN